jgi:hypothetical protein
MMRTRRTFGVAAAGVLIGLASLVAGWTGLIVAVVAAVMCARAAPPGLRVPTAGLLLATAGFTMGLLLGRVCLDALGNPSISLAPGTVETAVAALVVGCGGTVAVVASRSSVAIRRGQQNRG